MTFQEEFRTLLCRHEIEWDDRYFWIEAPVPAFQAVDCNPLGPRALPWSEGCQSFGLREGLPAMNIRSTNKHDAYTGHDAVEDQHSAGGGG